MTTLSDPLDPPSSEPAAVPPRARSVPVWLAIVAASVPMFMATLDNLVMTSALPVIRDDLNASVGQLQWFMNAYTLAFATLMLSLSTLGDRLGRRRVFLWGIAVFTAASIASALSTSPEMLIAARAVQGVGAAAVMPLSLTLLAGAVPTAKRALAIGVWGGVSGLGVALGPVVGGAVVDGVSWQAVFWLNVPVAALAVPLVLYALRESTGPRQPLDPMGVLLSGGAVFLGVWGIVHGNDDGWTSVSVLGTLVAAVLLLVAFVVREWRAELPVMPLRLFRSRQFSLANVIALTFTLGMMGAVFLLSQYLQIVSGYSPFAAGLRTLPWTAAPMVVAPIAGLLAPRVGLRALLVTGLVLQGLSLVWMAGLIEPGVQYPSLVPAFVMAGVGMGLTFAPTATAVLADMREADHATASSINSTLREVGVALGIAILTAVFLGAGGSLTPAGYTDALAPALYVGAGFVAVAVAAAALMPPRRAAQSSPRRAAQSEPRRAAQSEGADQPSVTTVPSASGRVIDHSVID
ncbi:DHA2 family efflux MFS transporter permease subunit [Rhodococcus hoagii]|uniref:MFS transporter n=1 Tax=Rhodococcus hoagii (strain 103S) TaxID=685727 RepID=A0A3S5Y5X8_RHOH1|nr:MFS transporter [Prescottella equi]MDP8015447.1 MFS transporter [Prescottella equi]NKR86167.1 DHA2 family efflux MFS transporter permease subunit [Prescottella equi]NKS05686.1 DHA2 family efflux MFS transporter permease subunit [Prescottella equi]NKS94030.1 DHA2 family efflux MFS transporter permease subunit [Prescottella equi]NKT08403.1 DHA2 family efflux MFS transporter permease subunit [Prescottella equi]